VDQLKSLHHTGKTVRFRGLGADNLHTQMLWWSRRGTHRYKETRGWL